MDEGSVFQCEDGPEFFEHGPSLVLCRSEKRTVLFEWGDTNPLNL